MNKLSGVINALDYKELKAIEKDLYEGNIGKLIKDRMLEIEKSKGVEEKICPICGTPLTEDTAKFVLVFGSNDFRKKALFDESDCLSFFIEKLKPQNRAVNVIGYI